MEYNTDHTLEITGASAAKIFAMLQQVETKLAR